MPTHVALTATEATWVQIHNADGTAIFTRELQPGDVYHVPAQPGLVIDTGNAKGVDVSVDGVAAQPLAKPGASIVRHNLSLDPDRLGATVKPAAQPTQAVASADALPIARPAVAAQPPRPIVAAPHAAAKPVVAENTPVTHTDTPPAVRPAAVPPQPIATAHAAAKPITAEDGPVTYADTLPAVRTAAVQPQPIAAAPAAVAKPAPVEEKPTVTDSAPIVQAALSPPQPVAAPPHIVPKPRASEDREAVTDAPPAAARSVADAEPPRPAPARTAARAAPSDDKAIELETGKGSVVQLREPAATVFVANPEIADVQVKSPSLIYVFGKAPGETSLYASDGNDHVILQAPVHVTHNLSRLRETLSRMMPDEPIQVESVESAIVLSGNVSSAAHAADAGALAALFVNPAQGSSQGQPQGGGAAAGASPAPSSGSQTQAGSVVNRLSVIAPNQVNIRIRVAEVNRSTLQALGINWNHMGERVLDFATGNPTFLANQATQNVLQVGIPLGNGSTLSTELDAMAQEGLITNLAEPNLTAMTGQTANFLAGGEFPIPVAVTTNGGVPTISVDYKKYGVSVEFLPTILDSNRISLRLLSEVSELTTQGAVQISGFSIPALTVRRAQTSVELGSGNSFVIAGLLQNNAEHDISKIPALGDIPVLGPLFRSDRFQRQETELVIIVTPYLVQPMAVAGASPTDGLNRPNDLVRPFSGQTYRQDLPSPGATVPSGNGRGLAGPAGFQLD